MDREGARECVESKMRHEDAGSSARLRGMLQGCDGRCRSDSTKFDEPRKFETAQDKMLEVKAQNIIENVIHEQTQDIEVKQPQPMSKLRKLSDTGMDCQGGGTRDAKRRKLDVSLKDGPTLSTHPEETFNILILTNSQTKTIQTR